MKQYVVKNQKRLRMGITTGTCAAAAAEAAALRLLLGVKKKSIFIHTPKGMTVEVAVFPVVCEEIRSEYMVVKDSGDDPDVTNHAKIHVRVEKVLEGTELGASVFWEKKYSNLYLDGGIGVGRITKEGLEQKRGQAAINIVPRVMIFQAVDEICEQAEYSNKLLITVCVPEGEALAKRTFNPRLGIEGGISILGTSGILEPMSEKAIIDTIEAQIRQLSAQGETKLLATPGNYGQGYAAQYLNLNMEHSIKCSNYIGDTLDLAVAYGIKDFLLIGNMGKLVKLAAGIMNTHSRVADARCEIVAVHTVLCGGSRAMAEAIMECINTEEMLTLLEQWEMRENVIRSLCGKIGEALDRRGGAGIRCGAVLFSEKIGFLGETDRVDEMLKEW